MFVVGLGTQDSLGEAEEFVAEHQTDSFTMLWDGSYETWLALGINSQPSAILLEPDGTPITGWFGQFPEDTVLELAADASA